MDIEHKIQALQITESASMILSVASVFALLMTGSYVFIFSFLGLLAAAAWSSGKRGELIWKQIRA